MEDGVFNGGISPETFALRPKAADIPDAVLEHAAYLLLDTLGVAAAATPLDAGRIARETAVRLYGTSDPAMKAHVMFDGRTASMAGAAFAAGTQIDNLDAHDGYNPVKGHIGSAVVPALCTLGEQAPDLSGRDALAALVVGYEFAARAGLSLHATVSDYHTSGAWNALGVAAMGAHLRNLSAHDFRQAIGIAEYHGPRSQMMREIEHPTMLHDGSGMGAFIGISAVVLAELGFEGAPAITVEDSGVAQFWADLGTRWLTLDQYIKPYPICRWAHGPIDCAAKLRREHDLTAEQIAQVRIGTFEEASCLFPGAPQTTSQAQYSLPFSVAAMLAKGQVGVPEITGDGLTDPAVLRLLAATDVVVEERHNARFPEGRWGDVTVTLTDGRVLASGDINAHGGPDDPFTKGEFIDKFAGLVAPVLGAKRASTIQTAILNLTDPDARFADLLAHLHAAP